MMLVQLPGRADRAILGLEYGNYDFQNPPYMASRKLLITRSAASGIPRLAPYRAKPSTATWLSALTGWR
jgi:hypothetical protein